jgi:maltoporin
MLFFLALLSTSLAWGAAPNFELHGYLRAGAGTNGKGAKQECFTNQGTPSGSFRLGNECGIYGESSVLAHFLEKDKNPFFRSQLRFAYSRAANTSYEDGEVNLVEAFAEGGGINGSPLTYWVGKRFYRDVDSYLLDWYYFAQMNGNGAGVGNIPLGSGFLAAALLFEAGSPTTRTDIGVSQLNVLDLRWQEIMLGEKHRLHLWGAFGEAPGGISAGTEYLKRKGWLGGARWRRILADGFNDLTVVHGQNLLEGMGLSADSSLVKTPGAPPAARRWRFVENLAIQPLAKLGLHGTAAFEMWDPRATGQDHRGSWWALAARPVYFFNDYYHLSFEAGHSVVNDRSERNADNSFVGRRSLTRFTIAPEIGAGPGLWSRPVLRIFYSRSYWNEANRSRVAAGAPTVAGRRWGESLGVQTELWF